MISTQLQQASKLRRESIRSHNWKGKGIYLKALISYNASDTVQQRLLLQKQFDAERAALKRNYIEKPFRSWRDFCTTRSKEGDRAAQRALRGFRYRDRRKKEAENQLLLEGEVLKSELPRSRLDLKDFFCFIHGDGQIDFFDRSTQILAFSDHGKSIHVFDHQNEKALEAALLIALEKWGNVKLKGDAAFQTKIRRIAKSVRAEKYLIGDSHLQADTLPKPQPVPKPENISPDSRPSKAMGMSARV